MDKYLSVREVAERLSLTQKAVRQKIYRQQLPGVRLGRLLRVPEAKLESILHSKTVAVAAEEGKV